MKNKALKALLALTLTLTCALAPAASTYTMRVPVKGISAGASASADPYGSYDSLLMHMDGTSGSTTLVDVLGNTVSNPNNATLSGTRYKFGSTSLSMSAGQQVSFSSLTPFTFPGDFTEEFWIYPTQSSMGMAVFDSYGSGGQEVWITAGSLYYYYQGGANIGGNISLTTNVWHHIAVTRQSGTLRLFYDGAVIASVTGINQTLTPGQSKVGLNYEVMSPTNTYVQGYLDELRITKGLARYTSSFTPPTAAFANP